MNCNNSQSDFLDMPQERENYYNFDADISITELKLAVKSLKCNKAVGIGGLSAEVLKCYNLLDALLALFNVFCSWYHPKRLETRHYQSHP